MPGTGTSFDWLKLITGPHSAAGESGKCSLAACPGKKVNIGADGLQQSVPCTVSNTVEVGESPSSPEPPQRKENKNTNLPLSLGILSQISDTSLNRKMYKADY